MAEWYSDTTGRVYPDKDALVAAEGHGWVVVALIPNTVEAAVWGLWPTRSEAHNAVNRLKTEDRRNPNSIDGIRYRVRPLWKQGEDRTAASL